MELQLLDAESTRELISNLYTAMKILPGTQKSSKVKKLEF